MLFLSFLILLVLSLGHWLFTPMIQVLTPLLSLSWIGWMGFAVAVWLLSGARPDEPPSKQKPESTTTRVDLPPLRR